MGPMMQAAVAHAIPTRSLEIEALEVPVPTAPDDVLVRVESCGICGTDLHIMDGHSYRPRTPFVLGHEPVGTVVAAGDGASSWMGRRVTITLFTGDGSCRYCAAGDERLCPGLVSITGVLEAWGGYADYVLVHARQLVDIPAALSSVEAATLVDCGATAANSVRVALRLEPARVLVVGAGPIGFMCAELLRVAGVPVQVVQRSRLRRVALERIGHDVVPTATDAVRPVDVVIDCAGTAEAVAPGVEALAPHGMYLLAGYALVPGMDFATVARKEADIRGIRSGRREDLESIVALATSKRIRLPEITRFRLSDANAAIRALRDKELAGKAVIVPDGLWSETR